MGLGYFNHAASEHGEPLTWGEIKKIMERSHARDSDVVSVSTVDVAPEASIVDSNSFYVGKVNCVAHGCLRMGSRPMTYYFKIISPELFDDVPVSPESAG